MGVDRFFQRGDSLYLNPNDDNVNFDNWNDLGNCNGNCSASVAVLALCPHPHLYPFPPGERKGE